MFVCSHRNLKSHTRPKAVLHNMLQETSIRGSKQLSGVAVVGFLRNACRGSVRLASYLESRLHLDHHLGREFISRPPAPVRKDPRVVPGSPCRRRLETLRLVVPDFDRRRRPFIMLSPPAAGVSPVHGLWFECRLAQ